METKKLLLIVDPQIDFVSGSLPVSGAAKAMDALAEYVDRTGDDYAAIVTTSDWHPYHHCSFAAEGGQWPTHCVQHSQGAAVWPSLLDALDNTRGGFTMLYKGDDAGREEYSIMQNAKSAEKLRNIIAQNKIGQIDVCGLAGNVCVLNTLRDLKAEFGPQMLNVLEAYSPSLDDGSQLRSFIKEIGK